MNIRTLDKLRIDHFLVVGVLSLFTALGVLDCHAADLPTASGKFTFDGKPHIGTATLTNTIVTNASLFLNGVYYTSDGKPYTAVFRPSVFHYDRFTTVVKLRPEMEMTSKQNWQRSPRNVLLAGGPAHRWLVLSCDPSGKVKLSLNNNTFNYPYPTNHPIKNLTVTNGQWTTLALTVDLQAKSIVTYANGNRVDELRLPKDFVLSVMNDEEWKEADKELTFTDYSDAGTFHGHVAGLLTFDAILTDDQACRLTRSIQVTTNGIGDLR